MVSAIVGQLSRAAMRISNCRACGVSCLKEELQEATPLLPFSHNPPSLSPTLSAPPLPLRRVSLLSPPPLSTYVPFSSASHLLSIPLPTPSFEGFRGCHLQTGLCDDCALKKVMQGEFPSGLEARPQSPSLLLRSLPSHVLGSPTPEI